ncbi:glycosyltransferase [Aeromonas veronii]|uniref:glycosyltransferase family 2 protein n=1 Tax=Aeromonas veronii TaxID=654 RepID=UPI00188BDF36|nr:glycosyltransferase [Aeromonas veronii]MBF3237317.1 glycosyltransferase [Aeromonas veronii]
MSENEKNGLSVIIPAFNAENTIGKTLTSVVRSLDDIPYEIIIIDDGSSDGTKDIVEEFRINNQLVSLLYIYQGNQGVSAARNNGVNAATYQLISFLDADDIYLKDFKKFYLFAIDNKNRYDFFSSSYFINSKKRIRKHSSKNVFIEFLDNQFFCTNSVIVTKKVFEKERFRIGFKYGEDVDLWLRLIIRYRYIHLNDYFVSEYNFIPKLHDSRYHPFITHSIIELNLSEDESNAVWRRFTRRSNLISSFKRECSVAELLSYKSLVCIAAYCFGEKGYERLWKIKSIIRK